MINRKNGIPQKLVVSIETGCFYLSKLNLTNGYCLASKRYTTKDNCVQQMARSVLMFANAKIAATTSKITKAIVTI